MIQNKSMTMDYKYPDREDRSMKVSRAVCISETRWLGDEDVMDLEIFFHCYQQESDN